ncbi:LysR family transcriptional regulator [Ramlibacter tataouinensis]|uniref:LysR family transcriptional regulator n=1 Tax=Ramlibacter tataouinensis TaxID=94132 RepID=UPI0022F3CFE4|nr:LysR family transcriptional regulator [Ramlibacter tataouinensis]WBY01039.1 LysR family transcriptional regulator [Ramlibacter tataouinensis]
MLPDLDSINIFLRAVQLKSLSKAAEASHISPSAASRRLALLEHQFRTPLLERKHDGVLPTAAGEALARHAQLLMLNVEGMRADLSDYARGAVGRVHLQANTSAMSQDLPAQLAKWSRSHPDIHVDVQEVRSGDIVAAVRRGTVDVGVVTSAPLEDLHFESYCRDRLCVVVPAAHRLRVRQAAFADLLEYDFVALDDTANTTQSMKSTANALGAYLRLRVQVQSFEAVCRLVAAGQGIGLLPKGAVKALKHSMKLRLIDLTDDWANREMYVCVKKGRLSPPVTQFVEHLLGRPLSHPAENSNGIAGPQRRVRPASKPR